VLALYIESKAFDLNDTPFLQVAWRTDSTLGTNIDEKRRQNQGDDYVGSPLMLVRSGGFRLLGATKL